MITNDTIISQVQAYCLRTGMAESTFGKKAVNDGKLLSRLRSGKSISLDTYNRIMIAMNVDREAAE